MARLFADVKTTDEVVAMLTSVEECESGTQFVIDKPVLSRFQPRNP